MLRQTPLVSAARLIGRPTPTADGTDYPFSHLRRTKMAVAAPSRQRPQVKPYRVGIAGRAPKLSRRFFGRVFGLARCRPANGSRPDPRYPAGLRGRREGRVEQGHGWRQLALLDKQMMHRSPQVERGAAGRKLHRPRPGRRERTVTRDIGGECGGGQIGLPSSARIAAVPATATPSLLPRVSGLESANAVGRDRGRTPYLRSPSAWMTVIGRT